MRLLLITLGLLAIGLPAQSIDLLPDDATFSKTVTMDFKGESLSDITKALSKATGVNVRASADVSDQKATILVDNMPLRDVMNGLATLYGWSWAVKSGDDGNTYIIYDPLRKKREADRKEALDKAWKALETKLNSLSFEGERPHDHYAMLAVLQYRALSPKVREAFLSGMTVRFDSESSVPAWQPSQAVMDAFYASKTGIKTLKTVDGKEVSSDCYTYRRVIIELSSFVGKNTIKAQSSVHVMLRYTDTNGSSMGRGRYSITELCTQEIDYPSEVLKNVLPREPEDVLLGKKVSISAADLTAEGAFDDTSGICNATRTDLLAALHNKLGLQIISDYYSSWDRFSDVQDTTVKQLVEEKQLPGFAFDWGWDGKFLYTRVEDIRTADSCEIPNRLLRPWQAVVKRQGYMGLNELAEAALLGDEQKETLCRKNCRCLKLGEIGIDWSSTGGFILRFYGLLTPKQRKELFSGEVGVMELTQEQKGALASIIQTYLPLRDDARVGVYTKDGLNIDEPHVVRGKSSAPAVSVLMVPEWYFEYISTKYGLFAANLEEALARAQHQYGDDFDPRNVVPLNDLVYKLIVLYEGYSSDDPIIECFGGEVTEHSSYHWLTIKAPDKKGHSSR